MSQQKPKGYWAFKDDLDDSIRTEDGAIHLVEYLALEAAQAELKEAIEWKNHFMELVEGELALNERWQNENSKLQAEIAELKKKISSRLNAQLYEGDILRDEITKLEAYKAQADKLAEALIGYHAPPQNEPYDWELTIELGNQALKAYAKFKEGMK